VEQKIFNKFQNCEQMSRNLIIVLSSNKKKSLKFIQYSRTSRKRPSRLDILGGSLREVVAYENLDHILRHVNIRQIEYSVCTFFL